MKESYTISYEDLYGRLHQVTARKFTITKVAGRREPGERKPYDWGKKERLLSMAVGEKIEVDYFNPSDRTWSPACSAIKRETGGEVVFKTRVDKINCKLIITRKK